VSWRISKVLACSNGMDNLGTNGEGTSKVATAYPVKWLLCVMHKSELCKMNADIVADTVK